MATSHVSSTRLDRRQFLRASAAAAGLSMMPNPLGAQAAPWAARPAGSPPDVTFVVWQYGKIYEQIAKQFEQDWSVKVNQIIEPNVEPQVAKLTAMYAAGDTVDVSQSPMQYLASYIDQGIATPIDGLPGVDQYVKDFTPFTKSDRSRRGSPVGVNPSRRSTSWPMIARISARARLAPRQWCAPPPKVSCWWALGRRRSSRSGSGNVRGSRLAVSARRITNVPGGNRTPS